MLSPALAAAAVYLLTWNPILWSVGNAILCDAFPDHTHDGQGGEEQGGEATAGVGDLARSAFLSPPVIASAAGLAAGSIAPVRTALIGPNAPLRFIFSSLRSIGGAALPAAVIVLGGALSRALREGEEKITLSSVLQVSERISRQTRRCISFLVG